MQTRLLTVATALIASACVINSVARTPQPVNEPAPLPAGVKVVPEQGFVDTSNNAFPTGVSSVDFTFSGREVMPNPANTAEARLYYNDFDTPVETSRVATVDQMTWAQVSVLFKQRTWKLEGLYKVEVPEGMFVFISGTDASGEPVGTDPTPAMTLYYEIYRGYTISPASGPVENLDYADIRFPDADEVVINASISEAQFYLDNCSDTYLHEAAIEEDPVSGKKNIVRIKMREADGEKVTAPGTYGLHIPAGVLTFRVYGPGYAEDPTDFVEYNNIEILAKYVVTRGEQPKIEPSPEDELEAFGDFRLYLPEGMTLWFANTMEQSKIYRVDEATGEVDDSLVYAYLIAENYKPGEDFVTLGLYDATSRERISKLEPAPGTYCLKVAQQLLFGMWPAADGEEAFTGGSDPYNYYYRVVDINSGVECIGESVPSAETDGAFYNLYGVKVADNAASARCLPKGIYISGGRKIMIK